MANGLFSTLDDREGFVQFISEKYQAAPREIAAIMRCEQVLDAERIAYAHREYAQSLDRFSLYLHSENPDHYKRAGALLYALNVSKIVTDVQLEFSADELESGFSRVNTNDAEHYSPFVRFYEEFHNEALAFQVAYRSCAAYEAEPRPFSQDYLLNVCRYLKCETGLTVDSCFMLLKSLMM